MASGSQDGDRTNDHSPSLDAAVSSGEAEVFVTCLIDKLRAVEHPQ